jgi:hypothetical protein
VIPDDLKVTDSFIRVFMQDVFNEVIEVGEGWFVYQRRGSKMNENEKKIKIYEKINKN